MKANVIKNFIWFSGERRSVCDVVVVDCESKKYIFLVEKISNKGPSITFSHKPLRESLLKVIGEENRETLFIEVHDDYAIGVRDYQEVYIGVENILFWRDFEDAKVISFFEESYGIS